MQVLAHLSVAPMILWATPKEYLISLIVYFFSGCLGVSMTYHRGIAHRSWPMPRCFEVLGTLFATIGIVGSSLGWVAVHREHHKYSDTDRDPHSPHYCSWWKVQFLSMFYEPKPEFMKIMLKDNFHKFTHRHYFTINFLYALFLYLLDPFALVYAYLFPAFLLWSFSSLTNTLGHLWGYSSGQSLDKSRNNFLLAALNWGEGWHNNHHLKPNNYNFAHRWYEIDIGGLFISCYILGARFFRKY